MLLFDPIGIEFGAHSWKIPMVIKRFHELPTDEIEDFAFACKKVGLSPEEDFDVAMDEKYPSEGVGYIHRVAFVKRTGAPAGLQYRAGSGSSWIESFTYDLLASKFK